MGQQLGLLPRTQSQGRGSSHAPARADILFGISSKGIEDDSTPPETRVCSEASSRRVVWHDVDQPVSSASSVQICAAQALLKGKSLPCLRRLAHNRRLSQPRANRFDFMFAVGRMYFRVGCRSCGAFGVFGAKMPRIYKFGVYNSVALNWLPPI